MRRSAILRPVLAAALLAALAILPAAASAGATPASPYSAASAGNVEVTVPSEYPRVELSPIDDAGLTASLSVDQVLEATPGGSPQIVAVALPSNIAGPSAAPGGASNGLPLNLTADLVVYPSSAGLWAGPGDLVQPDGAPLATARLFVNVSVAPAGAASGGVALTWSVVGWPWTAPSDLLGVDLGLDAPLATTFVGCTSWSSAASPGCAGPTATSGTDAWASGVESVQQGFGTGPTALVTWSPSYTVSNEVGILAQTPSSGHLILVGPANGASHGDGSVAFALLPALPPVLAPAVLHGELGPFVAGGALAGIVAAGGVLLRRRREAAAERSL